MVKDPTFLKVGLEKFDSYVRPKQQQIQQLYPFSTGEADIQVQL